MEKAPPGALSRFIVREDFTSTAEEGPSAAIRNAHQQMLLMQADQTEKRDQDSRGSLSVSVSFNQREWQSLRDELKQAVIKVFSKYGMSKAEKNQVGCFTMQLIRILPITPTEESGV